jgi:hypothetical protein
MRRIFDTLHNSEFFGKKMLDYVAFSSITFIRNSKDYALIYEQELEVSGQLHDPSSSFLFKTMFRRLDSVFVVRQKPTQLGSISGLRDRDGS